MVIRSYDNLSSKTGFSVDLKNQITSDKIYLFISIFCVISILIQVSLILTSWGRLPPEIPIFYSRPWGEQMLATPIFLWILPSLTILFAGLNYLIDLFLVREYFFLQRVLILINAIIAFATLY